MNLEPALVVIALLLLLSILASKASWRLGVPALIFFIGVGMLAGEGGVGLVQFDSAGAAQTLGVVALAFILYAGGLETVWPFVRRSVWRAASLSTAGVVLTAGIIAFFTSTVLGFTLAEGLLLGAIVSATDAAATFSILRGGGVKLREDIASTLELESGSNDPMAVFLTTALVQFAVTHQTSAASLFGEFVLQMTLGALAGFGFGHAVVWLLNRLSLEQAGLYPVLTVAIVLLTYGATATIGGNGFLAVYIAGIVAGNHNFIQRRTIGRFHDGIAWLMQIAMFLALGLLVHPAELMGVAGVSLAIAFALMFMARPVAIFLSLAASRLSWQEKTLIAWAGLRGAVPIVLATFPLLAGVPNATRFFNIVFFVVLASVAVQGTTISSVAKWLGVDKPLVADQSPNVANLPRRRESALVTYEVAPHARAAGHRVVEIPSWPREAVILVLYRGDEFFVPNGATEVHEGDRLIVLTTKETVEPLRSVIEEPA